MCIAGALREKIFTTHSNQLGNHNLYNTHNKYYIPFTGDITDALAVILLKAHSNNPDEQFTVESIKLLMDQQHLVEYDTLAMMYL